MSSTKRRNTNAPLLVAGISLVVFLGSAYHFSRLPLCANTFTCTRPLEEQIDNQSAGMFLGQTVIPPKIDLLTESKDPTFTVLGDSTYEGEKHIYVDLSAQKLYAFQGGTPIMETLISSGLWGRTPIGNFNIQSKFRATRMAGGRGSDAYDLPNVPHTMFFYGDFGLHGAYWHNNFGHPMSHGCVNMRLIDARDLFNWADGPTASRSGTPVSVCDSFTSPDICIQQKPIK